MIIALPDGSAMGQTQARVMSAYTLCADTWFVSSTASSEITITARYSTTMTLVVSCNEDAPVAPMFTPYQ